MAPEGRRLLRADWGRLGRTLRTVRHLRPEQVAARTGFLAEGALERRRPGRLARRYDALVPRLDAELTDAPPVWSWPPAPFDPASRADPETARRVEDGEFRFLNRSVGLGAVVDWSPPGVSRLWRFQLHYFDYAVDLATAARRGDRVAYARLRSLVRQWVDRHPVAADDPWHPFVVSCRLLAWLTARDLLGRELDNDPDFARAWRRTILQHAAFLADHLETDVGGNHLLKNATALLSAGCAFQGAAAECWRDRASAVFATELPRQVLPDGGHYERSPMYHLLVLEDLLHALRPAGKRELPIAVPLARAVHALQRVAVTLRHPDGEIPLFNDAVLGEAPPPSTLVGPSTCPTDGALPATGYFLLPVSTDLASGVLLADCGPPGPDDLPAHVHADALSFELSIGGRRVLVDGGMDSYEPGPRRTWLRGTAAHNTVEVDGQDQSEIWGVFRVGRRARVRLEGWNAGPDGRQLVGSHDGYERLGVIHRREIVSVTGRGWRVQDTVDGRGHHVVVARLRLYPDLCWRLADGDALANAPDGSVLLRVRPFGPVVVDVEEGLYAERFGEAQPVQVLRLRAVGPLPVVFGCWLLPPGGSPAVV